MANPNRIAAVPAPVTVINAQPVDLAAELARLRAENEALRNAKATAPGISCKVSEKGALSVYGLGRFPVTLYREQWERLFAYSKTLGEYMNLNAARLVTKAQSQARKAAEAAVNGPGASPAVASAAQSA